ncbi:methylenetetrahydrofolate reductase [Roseovarius salinarum]|uniref:methylenetetrahydrofolate reductase n=1 Tax=Roseovarius salinarum TaxID=1981892 RepID=UPI0013000E3C|nr:methylenetetrahydrofolate reductase [Roseovarius salinarum]
MAEDASFPGQPTAALLRDLFETVTPPPLSFELFPPRSEAGHDVLRETVGRLAPVASDGFSVTMGAGGTARSGTMETVQEIAQTTGKPVTAHLTAIGHDRATVMNIADALWNSGITRVLALRGDMPRDELQPAEPSFEHASDLVAALRDRHDFEISVAAYPEKHPEAEDLDDDIDHLKEKLDAGASSAICQFVLNPESYARFLERCGQHGIDAPIVPGIMPLDDWPRVRNFALRTGASVPGWLDRLLTERDGEGPVTPLLAAAATLEQTRRLIAYGAPALHIYTLNHWHLPLALARLMGAGQDAAAAGA